MDKPFKFRHANLLAGSFVLFAMAVVVVGFVFTARTQRWFEKKYAYSVALPPQGAHGLREGSTVRMQNSVVGFVEAIRTDDNGDLEAEFSIQGEVHERVCSDSTVTVRRMWDVAGDPFLEISGGTGSPLPDKARLQKVADFEPALMQVVRDVIVEVQREFVPLIREARVTTEKAGRLFTTLDGHQEPVHEALVHVRNILADLDAGKGVAGSLLQDEDLEGDTRAIVAELKATVAILREAADTIGAGASEVPEMTKLLRQELEDLPGTVLQARGMLREIDKLIVAFQRHWLLKKYVEDPTERGPVRIPSSRALELPRRGEP